MKKRISILSIFSLIISVISTTSFGMLYTQEAFFSYVWLIGGSTSMFLPIVSKYFRIRNDRKGKGLEVAAIVIGFFNLNLILDSVTKWNSIVNWLLCVLVLVFYGIIFYKKEEHISETNPLQSPRVFSAAYWQQAARNLTDLRMLAFAALVVALRALCKMLEIPLAPGLNINVAAFFNSIGAMVYGPVVGVVGAIASDPLGYLLHPDGPYFLPFMLVDMSSSLIFGLFFWRQKPSVSRVLWAKFTINMVSNVVLTSLIMKWYYFVFYGVEKAQAYNLINLVRIVKNLVMFPLEAVLLTVVMGAAMPALYSLRMFPCKPELKLRPRHYILAVALTVFSVGLVLFYVFFLKEWISAHNIKLF